MSQELLDLLSQEGPVAVYAQLFSEQVPIEEFIQQAKQTLPLATDDVQSSFALLLEYAFDVVDSLLDCRIAQQRYSDALALLANLEELTSAIRENVIGQNAELVGGIWNRIAFRYHKIAEASQRLEVFAKAVSSVEAAFAISPDEPHIRENLVVMNGSLGQTFGMRQRFDQAIPYLKRVLEVNPQSDEAWRQLGLCYMGQSDMTNGVDCLKQAAKLGNSAAIDALRKTRADCSKASMNARFYSECTGHSMDEFRICRVCRESELADPAIPGNGLGIFTCEAHGKWMTGEWIATHYPAEWERIKLDSETRYWVCWGHLHPEEYKRLCEERMKKNEKQGEGKAISLGRILSVDNFAQEACEQCNKLVKSQDVNGAIEKATASIASLEEMIAELDISLADVQTGKDGWGFGQHLSRLFVLRAAGYLMLAGINKDGTSLTLARQDIDKVESYPRIDDSRFNSMVGELKSKTREMERLLRDAKKKKGWLGRLFGGVTLE